MDARKTDADQAAMRFSFHRQTIIENVIGPLSKATQPVTPLHCSGKRRLARSPARHPHAAGLPGRAGQRSGDEPGRWRRAARETAPSRQRGVIAGSRSDAKLDLLRSVQSGGPCIRHPGVHVLARGRGAFRLSWPGWGSARLRWRDPRHR